MKKYRKRSGFSLIEMLIVLTIGITIAGFLGVPAYQRASLQNQIAATARAVQSIKSAVALYNTMSDGRPLPITYTQGTATIPTTGTLGGANANLVIDLQTVLLNARCLDAPVSVPLGTKASPDLTTPVQWDPVTQTFFTAGDAAPTTTYRGSDSLTSYARLVGLSAATDGTSTLSPAGTRLWSFALDGVNALPSGTRIICWEFGRVSPNTAYELAKALYKGTVSPAGTGQFVGPVIYPNVTADGTVPVFVYVSHY